MKKLGVVFAVLGFLAVALGAFGAHGLKNILSEYGLDVFEKANRYHFYHVLALGLCLALNQNRSSKWLNRAAWLFAFGVFIFSGSLYTLAITEIKVLGAITPIGGTLFLVAWVFMGLGLTQKSITNKS